MRSGSDASIQTMSVEHTSPGTSAHSVQRDRPAYPGRDRREATHCNGSEQTDNKAPLEAEYLDLENTTVVLEHGPAGTIGRIEGGDSTEYAGPIPPGTIEALREVSV